MKNVYDKWMPGHFERICSAINQLPSGSDAPPLSEATGLSQGLGNLMQSGAYPASAGGQGSQSSMADQEAATPALSSSGLGVAKRRKGGTLADG